eukprot:42883-Hanusia_phi.AAC.1
MACCPSACVPTRQTCCLLGTPRNRRLDYHRIYLTECLLGCSDSVLLVPVRVASRRAVRIR